MKKFALSALMSASLLNGDTLFHSGAVALGLGVGGGSVSYVTSYGSDSKDYFIIGVGADYFVMENFSVGLSALSWVGSSPAIMQYTVPVVYYFDTNGRFSPYGGVFYRYTDYLGNYEDRHGNIYSPASHSASGFKVGVVYKVHFGYMGMGIVTERNFDTQETSSYPEFTMGFVF